MAHARTWNAPFLLWERYDGRGRMLATTPLSHREAVYIGRGYQNDVVIGWDTRVGRVHCKLQLRAGLWYLDDLDSRNGTFVGGVRVAAPHRLAHAEVIGLSSSPDAPRLWFDNVHDRRSTRAADDQLMIELTPQERRLLAAVCVHRLCGTGDEPATDAELELLLDRTRQATRRALTPIYEKLALKSEPQGRKRRLLATLAMQYRLASVADLPGGCAGAATRLCRIRGAR